MKITSFTPLVPANIKFEVAGKNHEIFVLLCWAPFTVIVPDADHYKLVKPQFDRFTQLLKEYLSVPKGIKVPKPPDDILQQVRMVQKDLEAKIDVKKLSGGEKDAL